MIPTDQKIDPQMAQKYVQAAMKKMENDPASLSFHERRLIQKYAAHKQQTTQLQRDLDQMRSQITQAEARVRSLELQVEGEEAKAENCIEILVSLKFEQEAGPPKAAVADQASAAPAVTAKKGETPAEAAARAKGNGAAPSASSPKNSKKRSKKPQQAARAN